ncbi:MAG TPA: response regulator transcription factor [Armatimonadota bacterium]|jgi:DNA-binding response OmpR family regulator
MAEIGLYGTPDFCARLTAAGMTGGDLALVPVRSWEQAATRLTAGDSSALVVELPRRDAAARRRLAELGRRTPRPVLVAVAQSSPELVADLLAGGAAEVVAADLSPREFIAHLRALLRRSATPGRPAAAEVLAAGRLRLDLGRHSVSRDGQPLALTPREFDLLAALLRGWGQVQRREDLLPGTGASRTLDAHLSRLRRKLGAAGDCGVRLTTVPGVGYRLDVIA